MRNTVLGSKDAPTNKANVIPDLMGPFLRYGL